MSYVFDAYAGDMASFQPRPLVCLIVGTRPEAIKISPIVAAMQRDGRLRPLVINTSQQPNLVEQAMAVFGLAPEITVPLRRETGTLAELATLLTPALERLLGELCPRAVVVQGDTSTALIGAQVAFWQRIPVVHVEAGLRSGRLDSPFPEEANRRMIGQIANLHLPPTDAARRNLARENVRGDSVLVTGNTSVDAIRLVSAMGHPYEIPELDEIEASGRRIVLMTCHRREAWGAPMRRLLAAARELVARYPDIHLVLPAHPNPAVRADVQAILGGIDRVLVCEPLSYANLARLLRRTTLVLSDSGGIQEEAPTFGVPALVMREVTERPEAVRAGFAKLVGLDPDVVLAEADRLLSDPAARMAMVASHNPFGDGEASERITSAVAWMLGAGDRPEPFVSLAVDSVPPSGRIETGPVHEVATLRPAPAVAVAR